MLPPGYSARPPVMDEAAIVTDLENERASRDTGRDGTAVWRTLMWWQESSRNLATDNLVVVSPSGAVVAYADFAFDNAHEIYEVEWAVTAAHQGLGIEEHLIDWAITRATQHAQTAPPDARPVLEAITFAQSQADQDLLRRAGFEQVRIWLRMQIDMTGPPPDPIWPQGISVRSARPDEVDDIHAAWEDAQSDEWGFTSLTDEEFRYYFVEKEENFDPSLWFLAIDDASGTIAGYALSRWERPGEPQTGQVRYVAVRAAYRRRGVARALLLHAFGEFYRRGKSAVNLTVDATSLTGADRLYVAVGMRTVQTVLTFARRV